MGAGRRYRGEPEVEKEEGAQWEGGRDRVELEWEKGGGSHG